MFRVGDQVIHYEHGEGEIVHIDGEIMTIAFDKEVESFVEIETDQHIVIDVAKSHIKEIPSNELEKTILRVIK